MQIVVIRNSCDDNLVTDLRQIRRKIIIFLENSNSGMLLLTGMNILSCKAAYAREETVYAANLFCGKCVWYYNIQNIFTAKKLLWLNQSDFFLAIE